MAGDRGAVVWRKSSYSNTTDQNCCEVAVFPGAVRVRDSKRPDSTPVSFTADAWCAAIALFLAPDATGRGHV
ncbi:DUF397 domain-containing protein [Streptomyces sp. NBC_00576]|uniref:DUF397 domain-containing protein n=1 Tax=Streptomyces sp. NBC_00576 TaxID=2903665 RepID=UPI002E8232A4|nr:DUF397 domain-containing protein [Streptomyces sp. NBC_00576]WUB71763.1 DUF397 domain-containing protein [Streptomyces sp. NBC_00576]